MKKVKLLIDSFNEYDSIFGKSKHYYGMIEYDKEKVELVREIDESDLNSHHFKTYKLGDETMRFNYKEDIINEAKKYCDKYIGKKKYKLEISDITEE